jgi:hypothetical protein
MYSVISMPKRQSIACGFSQTMSNLPSVVATAPEGGAAVIVGERGRRFNGRTLKRAS